MSAKREATYHGADIVTRLRAYEPEDDYDGVMQEAAQEIEKLRGDLASIRAKVDAAHTPVFEEGNHPICCRRCDWESDPNWPCATLLAVLP